MSLSNYMTISDVDIDYNKYANNTDYQTVKRRYFGKNTHNININGGKYIPSQNDCSGVLLNDTTDISKNAYLSIGCKCNELLKNKLPTIMNRSSDDYRKYMESDIYKKSPENMKDANAYLWYYATNRFNDENYKKHVKIDSIKDMSNNINIKKQMDYLAANIIANNFITFDNININNKLLNFNLINIPSTIIKIIAFIFFLYSSISLLVTIYNFLGFGKVQVNMFYTVLNKSYDYKAILLYFVLIILLIISVNYSPISIIYRLFGTSNVNVNSVIFGIPNELSKTDEKQENFTISRSNCVITPEKELKCECESDTCKNTRFGCCENSKNAKLDASGTNCSTIKHYPGYIVLSCLIGLVFGISYLMLNITNRKYTSVILFMICVMCIFGILFISFNYIKITEKGINITKNTNTCNNLVKYDSIDSWMTVEYSVIIYCVSLLIMILVGIGYLFTKKTIFKNIKNKSNSLLSIGSVLCSIIVFLSAIAMIFSSFMFAFSNNNTLQSLIYLIVIFVIRFLYLFIMKIITNSNININNKYINLLSVIYHAPIEHIYKIIKNMDNGMHGNIFNLLKSNFSDNKGIESINKTEIISNNTNASAKKNRNTKFLEHIELPSGMPWDAPGVKLFKIITFLVYFGFFGDYIVENRTNKNSNYLKFGMNYIPSILKKSNEYFSSNSQIFTSPFNIIFYIINLF